MRFGAHIIRNISRSCVSGIGTKRNGVRLISSAAQRNSGSLPQAAHRRPNDNNQTLQASATWIASAILVSSIVSRESDEPRSVRCDATPDEPSAPSPAAATENVASSSFAEPIEDIRTVYELGAVIGEGGFGQVYHARRIVDGEHVALKCIPKEWTLRDEFRRETDVLRRLSDPVVCGGPHPHVCRMFDVYEGEEEYWMAMELIEGGELFEHLIEEGAYSEARAAVFLRQFAEALSFVHKAGVVHGDLKPENLLLSSWDNEKAELKLVDFGCATVLGGEEEDEAPHSTIAYDPPEKLINDSPPSFKSDVWAAGCILYIVLTGTHPFDKSGSTTPEEMAELVKSIGTSEDRLSELAFDERADGLSPSVTSLLRRMLHPDPEKRVTGEVIRANRWVQGLTASWENLDGIDDKLERFWKKEFRNNVLNKFGSAATDEQLHSIFNQIDKDGNGTIELEELAKVLRESGKRSKEIKSIFDSINLDNDNAISFDEFKSAMKNELPAQFYQTKFRKIVAKELQTEDNSNRPEALRAAARRLFNSMDLDGNGTLDCHELRLELRKLGVDENEMSLLMASIDVDHDGAVSFDEFIKVMVGVRSITE